MQSGQAAQTNTTEVTVHPLVLLSTTDHYSRLYAGTVSGKRVVGVLLGTRKGGEVDVTNSFAIPFDEDPKAPTVFFMDHNYIESMCGMFRKVNARERVVGWYSTGPKIRPNDLSIHQIFRKFCPNPVYCIIEVEAKQQGIPTSSYVAIEEIEDQSSQPQLTFQHVPSCIGAMEAEEIGVEHLLRDVSDSTISTLGTRVRDKVGALEGLLQRLTELYEYLSKVAKGDLPINHHILYKVQDIFNLLPLLQYQRSQKPFAIDTNNNLMSMYVANMVRTIVALHDLIINKQDLEKKKIQKEVERKEKEEKAKKDAEEKAQKEAEEKEKKEKEEKEKAEKGDKMDEDKDKKEDKKDNK
eukprot:TRINITY_DN67711_c4_g1_i1.p1 TRINITY_DN67711_c4_g1~~TRINITY_DN67711_c4_g1_i1.p1  ORF type:complete len:353 (-),score=67.68 TRINITY_DN67711_c4_g1_i1:1330-2388(-)